jgi:hypothetical protein
MWKEIVGHKQVAGKKPYDDDWMPLEKIARAQLTSEDPLFPLENALSLNSESSDKGWMAGEAGPQTIALNFLNPVNIRRIFLHFVEHELERTQEFSLRYTTQDGNQQEIVRQQWNFSPNGATQEMEDFTVELEGVTRLELRIDPDLGHTRRKATLDSWRVA